MINGYLKGKPDTSWWMQQIRQGIAYRKKYAHEGQWPAWRRYYRGDFPPGVVPVNLFFRMARTIVPRTYFRNPSISVMATKMGSEQQAFAKIIERMDNKLIRSMGVKNQIKKMVQNCFMFGTAAGKLGFGAEHTPTPDMFETEAPVEYKTTLNRKVEYNSLVDPNTPWFLSVHPGNLIVPDMLQSYEETPWVATWSKRSLDEVQDDPRLKNTADLKSNSGPGLRGKESGMAESRPNMLDLVEIRDMRTEKVIILAPYSDGSKVLYYGDDGMQFNNRPNIYPIIFNPDDEVFWGVPDAHILEPQQLEANENRTLQMKHRRMSIVKFMYKKGSITKEEMEKMLDGTVMGGVEIAGELSDIDTMQVADIPQALMAADQIIQGDVRDTLGFSRNQAGEFAGQKSHSAPTAYETKVVEMGSSIRVDERRDVIADLLVDVLEDANVLVFDKFTEEQVIQVVGPQGIPLWVAFKPSMLKAAKYELNIDPDSSIPETKDIRTQKAERTYELLKTNPLIAPDLLTQYLLHEMHGVQFDNMMRTMGTAASQGTAGSTIETPMGMEQYISQLAGRGAGA